MPKNWSSLTGTPVNDFRYSAIDGSVMENMQLPMYERNSVT